MSGILQSGNVTPGHAAAWVCDGVIQDGGPVPASQRVLGSIRGANFNTTSDQPLLIPPSIAAFQLTGIVITNASVSLSVAAGGFYPATSKVGTAIVSSAQVYSALTGANLLLAATLSSYANTTRFSASVLPFTLIGGINWLTMFFSLTTAQGVPATADIYMMGCDLT